MILVDRGMSSQLLMWWRRQALRRRRSMETRRTAGSRSRAWLRQACCVLLRLVDRQRWLKGRISCGNVFAGRYYLTFC